MHTSCAESRGNNLSREWLQKMSCANNRSGVRPFANQSHVSEARPAPGARDPLGWRTCSPLLNKRRFLFQRLGKARRSLVQACPQDGPPSGGRTAAIIPQFRSRARLKSNKKLTKMVPNSGTKTVPNSGPRACSAGAGRHAQTM